MGFIELLGATAFTFAFGALVMFIITKCVKSTAIK